MVIVAAVDDTTDSDIVAEGRTLADVFNEELHVVYVRDREEVEAASGGTETVLEGAESDAADIAAAVTDEFVRSVGLGTQYRNSSATRIRSMAATSWSAAGSRRRSARRCSAA